jgi:hypothetical protein
MSTCPLCGSPAEITDVPQFASRDVECPECKKFRITDRALEFIERNPARVKDQLPLVSRAARAAEVPLLITDDKDIAETAAKQQAAEAGAPPDSQ